MRFDEFLFVQHSSGSQTFLLVPMHILVLHLACPEVPQGAASLSCCTAGAQEQLPALLSPSTEALCVPEWGQGLPEFLAKICSFMQSSANIHSSSKCMSLLWARQKVWREGWRCQSKSFWHSGKAGSVWCLRAVTPDPSQHREVHVAQPVPRMRNSKAIHTGESLGIQTTDVRVRI